MGFDDRTVVAWGETTVVSSWEILACRSPENLCASLRYLRSDLFDSFISSNGWMRERLYAATSHMITLFVICSNEDKEGVRERCREISLELHGCEGEG
jgi:hypothetical protein